MRIIRKSSKCRMTISQKCEMVRNGYSGKSFRFNGNYVTICGISPSLDLTDGSTIFAIIICGDSINKQKHIEKISTVTMFFKDRKKRYSCLDYYYVFDKDTNLPRFEMVDLDNDDKDNDGYNETKKKNMVKRRKANGLFKNKRY